MTGRAETDAEARLADMLVRCGIERGVLGRIDADNVARILLPVVREIADLRAAEALRKLACDAMERTPGAAPVTVTVAEILDQAAALRGEAGR